MQPIIKRNNGTPHFKPNEIVNALLDHGQSRGFGLNEIARLPFSAEDYQQLMQLIGYTVNGYCELSTVSEKSKNIAEDIAATLK